MDEHAVETITAICAYMRTLRHCRRPSIAVSGRRGENVRRIIGVHAIERWNSIR
jgi:hypothetical protein